MHEFRSGLSRLIVFPSVICDEQRLEAIRVLALTDDLGRFIDGLGAEMVVRPALLIIDRAEADHFRPLNDGEAMEIVVQAHDVVCVGRLIFYLRTSIDDPGRSNDDLLASNDSDSRSNDELGRPNDALRGLIDDESRSNNDLGPSIVELGRLIDGLDESNDDL